MSKHLILFITLVLLISCKENKETTVVEKEERVVTIEIDSSDVVKLDGKEIHISFLENQMEAMAEDFDLAAAVKVDSGGVVGPVTDVTQAIKNHTSRFITRERAVLK